GGAFGGVEAVGAAGVLTVTAGLALAALLAPALVDGALGPEEALEDVLLALEGLLREPPAAELALDGAHPLGGALEGAARLGVEVLAAALDELLELLADGLLLGGGLPRAGLLALREPLAGHVVEHLLELAVELLLLLARLLHLLHHLLHRHPGAAAAAGVLQLVEELGEEEGALVEARHRRRLVARGGARLELGEALGGLPHLAEGVVRDLLEREAHLRDLPRQRPDRVGDGGEALGQLHLLLRDGAEAGALARQRGGLVAEP